MPSRQVLFKAWIKRSFIPAALKASPTVTQMGHWIRPLRPFPRTLELTNMRRQKMKEMQIKLVNKSKSAGHGFMALWRQYGYIGIGTYFSVYGLTLITTYGFVSQGMLSTEDIQDLAQKLHLEKHLNQDQLKGVDTFWSRLLLAWIACKILEPIRAAISLVLTPPVARLLWATGWVTRSTTAKPSKTWARASSAIKRWRSIKSSSSS